MKKDFFKFPGTILLINILICLLFLVIFSPSVYADDDIATTFSNISASLADPFNHAIINNLNEVNENNVSSFSGLYFKKNTFGKIEFTEPIDLSSIETQNFLQSFANSDGPLQFLPAKFDFNINSTIASAFLNKTARITFYRLDWYVPAYVDLSSITIADLTAHLVAKESDTIVKPTFNNAVYLIDVDSDGETYSFAIDVPHFTSYELDFSYPSITAPVDIMMEATEALTPVDLGLPVVVNPVSDPNPEVVITISDISNLGSSIVVTNPVSLPLGLTIVTWTVTSTTGYSAVAAQNVFITDYTPPSITTLPDILLEATSLDGTPVDFINPTAFDLVYGETEVICDHLPGSSFPIGTTLVTCNTNDPSSNFTSTTFNITTQDTKIPTITINSDIVVDVEMGSTYIDASATVYDDYYGVEDDRLVVENNVDTSIVGEYKVTYNATDNIGNKAVEKIRTVRVFDPTTKKVVEHHNSGGAFIGRISQVASVASATVVSPVSIGKVLGAQTFNFTTNLKSGIQGVEVKELQKILKDLGYDCGNMDGIFGPKTKAAVFKLQIANKIFNGYGTVGPLTRAILNR